MQLSDAAGGTRLGPLQIALLALAGIAAVGGAIVCIVDPTSLTFHDYATKEMPALAGALGLGMVGKGIHLSGVARAASVATQLEPTAAKVMLALERGDLAGALGAFESGVPKRALPSDQEERVRPGPRPSGFDPERPPPDTAPAAVEEQAPPPPPAVAPVVQPEPLSADELATLRALEERAQATGQA